MIKLSCYTDDIKNMLILFYENDKQKYQKSLAYRPREFTVNKYFYYDFTFEKEYFTKIDNFELSFNELYKEMIYKMIFNFKNLLDDDLSDSNKPSFWRGCLYSGTKCITVETGIKYAKQIIKQFYKEHKEMINSLNLPEETIIFLKSL